MKPRDKAEERLLGTQIIFPDGREATVVYNSLEGVGIKWGLHDPPKTLLNSCPLFRQENPEPEWAGWKPEAWLRGPCPGSDLPCVGRDFKITRHGFGEMDGVK